MRPTVWLATAACLIIPPVLVAQQPDSAKKADTLAPVTISGSFTTSFTYSNHPVDTTIVGRAYERFQNMFSLNVVRIVLFFSFALAVERRVQIGKGRELYEWLFHTNIGWLLYFVALAVWMSLVVPARLPPAAPKQK